MNQPPVSDDLDVEEPLPEREPVSFTVFYIAGGISAVWLLGAILLGWFAHPDGHGLTFGGLAANEWGDFLAGVFAPIAFFGLAATLWIQSAELRDQRWELVLTRHEYENQRKIMKAEVLEARAQAALMTEQTRILTEQDNDRKTARLDDYFDEHVLSIVAKIRANKDFLALTYDGHDLGAKNLSNVVDKFDLEEFGARFFRHVEDFTNSFADGQTLFRCSDAPGFYQVKHAFERAKDAGAGISSMARMRYQRYGIDDAIAAFEIMESMTDFPPEE